MRNGRQPLSCKELVALITEYLEGTLSRADHKRFDKHLSGCDGCTTYIEQMRKTIRLAGQLREEELEPAARDELLAAFRDWKSR
jgi:anti-sigma factor RsiW